MKRLTQALVKELFDYNPSTGELIRIKTNRQFLGRVAGYPTTNGYLQVKVKGMGFPVHGVILLWMTGSYEKVDHIDCDKTNNRWDNLRICDVYQNSQNKCLASNNTSGTKGIDLDSHGYKARIQAYGIGYSKRFSLHKYRSHSTALCEATKWLQAKRIELHGEFANHG